MRTNVVPLAVPDMPGFGAAARERGMLLSVLGPPAGRLVTHLDVTDDDVDRAVEVLTGLLKG